MLAVVVVAVVEAVRKRVSLDGWPVLAVAAGASLVLATLFADAYSAHDIIEAGRTGVLAWVIAVGGDAWVGKIASKARLAVISGGGGDA